MSDPVPVCMCERCQVDRWGFRQFMASHPDGCGCKRCPASVWHGYICTGSNEPDQPRVEKDPTHV